MAKLRSIALVALLIFLVFGISSVFIYSPNFYVHQFLERSLTPKVTAREQLAEDESTRVFREELPSVKVFVRDEVAEKLIQARNNLSRLLNAKQSELARWQCEKVERENKTIEQTSQTGGWCIHDAKELGSGGFHATDLKLVPALIKFFKGKRVASFGDGPGRYKKLLDESGQLAVYDAFDGAPYSESLSEGRVKFLDLTIPQYGLPLYDYVISLEVAEHIPKEYEAIYVDNVIRHAKEGIVLSWAWPGQEGHSHVNGKALEDVIKLLKDKGFEHDPSSSEVLKQSSTFMWLKKSTNVYKRKEINEELLKMNT